MNSSSSKINIPMLVLFTVFLTMIIVITRTIDDVDFIGLQIGTGVITRLGDVVVVDGKDRSGGAREFGRSVRVTMRSAVRVSVCSAVRVVVAVAVTVSVSVSVARMRVAVVLELIPEATVRVEDHEHDDVEDDTARGCHHHGCRFDLEIVRDYSNYCQVDQHACQQPDYEDAEQCAEYFASVVAE